MREGKGRGWAVPLAAAGVVLLVLSAIVGSWTWRNARWWRQAPPDGEVLIALRFPPDSIKPEHQAAFVELLADAYLKYIAPLLRKEWRANEWPRSFDIRFTVSADRVPDLEAFADRCFAHWDNVFAMDGLLLVRGTRGEVMRRFRAYRPP